MPTIEQYYQCPVLMLYWVHCCSEYDLERWNEAMRNYMADGPIGEALEIIRCYGKNKWNTNNTKADTPGV